MSLNQFEQSTHKVGQSLNKMVDQFSGAKILREAKLAEEAVLRIGGASKLTESEQARVNATITEALAKYRALGVEAPRSLQMMADETKKVEQAMSAAVKPTSSFLDSFKAVTAGMLTSTAIIGAVKSAFGALTEFIGSSIQSYAAAEAAQKKLNAALIASGNATPKVIAQYNQLAKEFQNTTVFSDDLITEMQALLTEVGGVMPGEMRKALDAATNLASGLGIDLRQATMLVGKAFEGETGTLKRYGIVIDEAKLKAEGMPAVLDAIQKKFGGQATAELNSYAGAVKDLKNTWDNFKEVIGEIVVTNPLVEAATRALRAEIKNATGTVEDHTHSWSNLLIQLQAAGGQQSIPFLGGPLKALEVFIRRAEDAADAANKIARENPALINPIPSADEAQLAQDARKAREEQEKLKKATEATADAKKKAAEAAKQYAEAIRNLTYELSDAKLQGEVKKLTSAFTALKGEGDPTAAELERVGKAAKTLYDQGAQLSPSLFNVMVATQNLLPPMQELSAEMLNSLGPALKSTYDLSAKLPPVMDGLRTSIGTTFGIEMPAQVQKAIDNSKKLHDSLGDISKALSQLAQVSGGSFGGLVSELATMVTAVDAAKKSFEGFQTGLSVFNDGGILKGILGMSTGILGMAAAAIQAGKAIANLFDQNKGRDLVIETFGDLDALREKLNQLDDQAEANRLWIALTQGNAENNPAAAKAAIEAIQKALGDLETNTPSNIASEAGFKTIKELQDIADKARDVYEFMRDSGEYSAGQIADAFQKSKDAQIAAMDDTTRAFHDHIAKIDEELKGLQQSVANEAPEEVMGVIEAQARARIEQLAEERKRAEAEIQEAGMATREGAEETGREIQTLDGKLRENANEWGRWADQVRGQIDSVTRTTRGVAPPSPTSGGGGGVGGGASSGPDFGSQSAEPVNEFVNQVHQDLERSKADWDGWSSYVQERTREAATGNDVPEYVARLQADLESNKGAWDGWSAYVQERTGDVGTAFASVDDGAADAGTRAGAALRDGVGKELERLNAHLRDETAWDDFQAMAAKAGLTIGQDLVVSVESGLTSLNDLVQRADVFAVLTQNGDAAATALEQAFGVAAGSIATALGTVPAAMDGIGQAVEGLHATLSDHAAWDAFQAMAAQAGVTVGDDLVAGVTSGITNLQDLIGNVDVFGALQKGGATAAAALEQAFGLAAGSVTAAMSALTEFSASAAAAGASAGTAIQAPFEQAMDAIHGRLGAQAAWDQFIQMAGNAGITVGEDLRAGVESGLVSLDELVANRDVFEILSRNGEAAAAALEASFGLAAGSIAEAMAKAGQEGSVNFEGPMRGCFTRIEDLLKDPTGWQAYTDLAHDTADQAAAWLTDRIGASKETVDAILSEAGGWDAFRGLSYEALAALEDRFDLAAGTLQHAFDGAITDMSGRIIFGTEDWAKRFEIFTASAGGNLGDLASQVENALGQMAGDMAASTDGMAVDWNDFYARSAESIAALEQRLGLAAGSIQTAWGGSLDAISADTTLTVDEMASAFGAVVDAATSGAEQMRGQFAAANDFVSSDTAETTGDLSGFWDDWYARTADSIHDMEDRFGLAHGSIKTLTGSTLGDMTGRWGKFETDVTSILTGMTGKAEREAGRIKTGYEKAADEIIRDFEDVARGVEDALQDIDVPEIRIPVSFDTPDGEAPEMPEFATGTRGRFLDFGAGTNVRLHGRERVQTEAEVARQADTAAPAAQPSNVTINMTVHGSADRDFAERLVKLIGSGGSLYTRARGVLR